MTSEAYFSLFSGSCLHHLSNSAGGPTVLSLLFSSPTCGGISLLSRFPTHAPPSVYLPLPSFGAKQGPCLAYYTVLREDTVRPSLSLCAAHLFLWTETSKWKLNCSPRGKDGRRRPCKILSQPHGGCDQSLESFWE